MRGKTGTADTRCDIWTCRWRFCIHWTGLARCPVLARKRVVIACPAGAHAIVRSKCPRGTLLACVVHRYGPRGARITPDTGIANMTRGASARLRGLVPVTIVLTCIDRAIVVGVRIHGEPARKVALDIFIPSTQACT